MKRHVFAVLAGLAAAPIGSRVARADGAVSSACTAALSDGVEFSQNKRVCYEDLAARGNYQEIVDRIEGQLLGLSPQEKFFLATAYFGLSNRTGAKALQCHYALQAKGLLEDFLVERQGLFHATHTFGTSDDMKYVHHATKTYAAIQAVTGCEESSYTIPGLERYARRYAVDRVRGLFYKTADKDALHDRFNAKIDQMNNTMRDFVAIASQIETRYGLTLVEIDSGRQYLLGIHDRINGLYRIDGLNNDPVTVDTTKVGADDSFPTFTYDPTWKGQILATLDAQTAHYTDLVDISKNGEVAVIETAILQAINEETMEGYAERKEQTIDAIRNLTTSLILPVNFWTEMQSPSRHGAAAIDAAIANPSNDTLARSVAAQDAAWVDGMKSLCSSSTVRWYCNQGSQP